MDKERHATDQYLRDMEIQDKAAASIMANDAKKIK